LDHSSSGYASMIPHLCSSRHARNGIWIMTTSVPRGKARHCGIDGDIDGDFG
jgi:hypothetical protein